MRRKGNSGIGLAAASFLGGLVVGAVLVSAVFLLLRSGAVIIQAAAAVPLTLAVFAVGLALFRRDSLPKRDVWSDGYENQLDSAEEASVRGGRRADKSSADTNDHWDGSSTPRDTGTELTGESVLVDDVAVAETKLPVPAVPNVTRASSDRAEDSSELGLSTKLPAHPSATVGTATDRETQADGAGDRTGPFGPGMSRRLIRAWDNYRRGGDGLFTASGFKQRLAELGIQAAVRDGDAIGASGDVLVVEPRSADYDRFWVVPSFAQSPRAAPRWFEDIGDGALNARTQIVHRVAEGRWVNDTNFEVVQKGTVA